MFNWIHDYFRLPKKVSFFKDFIKREFTNQTISLASREGCYIVVCLEPRTALFGLESKRYILNDSKRTDGYDNKPDKLALFLNGGRKRAVGLNYIWYRPYIYKIPKNFTFTKKLEEEFSLNIGETTKHSIYVDITVAIDNPEKFYDYVNSRNLYTQEKIEFDILLKKASLFKTILNLYAQVGKYSYLNSTDICSEDFISMAKVLHNSTKNSTTENSTTEDSTTEIDTTEIDILDSARSLCSGARIARCNFLYESRNSKKTI